MSVVFPLQHLLHGHATEIRYTYIACLVVFPLYLQTTHSRRDTDVIMYTDIRLDLFMVLYIEVMFCCVVTSVLRMQAARLSETLVYAGKLTRSHNPERLQPQKTYGIIQRKHDMKLQFPGI